MKPIFREWKTENQPVRKSITTTCGYQYVGVYMYKRAWERKTGFPFLQEAYSEYAPGDIWVLGGWTSVGKSAIMALPICNLFRFADCPSILVISSDMTEAQKVFYNTPITIYDDLYRVGEIEVAARKAVLQGGVNPRVQI